ncbi:MAG TPA: TetR/AcrR family transcriptional regulator [Ktedonosporobacter sp.]|nr:TetR/AcrR family transcriptional regulator [Ktedonosporobacter sp.]
MARIVNEAAHAARRNAILDAAQRAVETKGYEQMAIADILGELQISSGAFYHYFDSKPALLSALVDRLGERIVEIVLPIVQDTEPGALRKLQRFFNMIDQWKSAHRQLVFAYLRVWYADENAIFRHKLYVARMKRLVPLLEEIIGQGTREGVFTTPYPDQAARMVLALLEDLGYATVEMLLAEEHAPDDLPRLQRIAEACADAMERVMGAPTGCLQRNWGEEVEPWLVPGDRKGE